jgi:integrase
VTHGAVDLNGSSWAASTRHHRTRLRDRGHQHKRPVRGFSKFKRTLDQLSGVTGWGLHDLRRTARSLMSRAGVNADIAERCLGHVIAGVRGVYDRHSFLEEKRAAFEALAAEITRILEGAR